MKLRSELGFLSQSWIFFILFVGLGLLVALVGGSRAFFSAERVRQWTENQSVRGRLISLEDVEVIWSWRGQLGLSLRDARFQYEIDCEKTIEVHAPQALVLFNSVDLIRAQIRAQSLQIPLSNLKLLVNPTADCSPRAIIPDFLLKRLVGTATDSSQDGLDPDPDPNSQSIRSTRLIELRDLDVSAMDWIKKTASLSAKLQLSSLSREPFVPVLSLKGALSPQLSVASLSGSWMEGTVDFDLKIQDSQDSSTVLPDSRSLPIVPRIELAVRIQHYPLNHMLLALSSELGILNAMDSSLGQLRLADPRLAWLNCALLIYFDERTSEISDCKIDGDLGQIALGKFSFRVSNKLSIEPFSVQLKNVRLDKIVGDRHFLSKNINKEGELSGDLRWLGPDQWNFEGKLKKTEFWFSRQGITRVWNIDSMRLKLSGDDSRLSGLVDEFQVFDGELKGILSMNFDRKLKAGFIQIAVSELVLPAAIQQLWFGGTIGSSGIFAKFKFTDSALEKAEGEVGLLGLESPLFAAEKLRLQFSYKPVSWSFITRVSKMRASRQIDFVNQLYHRLVKALGESDSRFDQMSYHDLIVQPTLADNVLRWSDAQVIVDGLSSSILRLTSAGSWSFKHGVAGQLLAYLPENKNNKSSTLKHNSSHRPKRKKNLKIEITGALDKNLNFRETRE